MKWLVALLVAVLIGVVAYQVLKDDEPETNSRQTQTQTTRTAATTPTATPAANNANNANNANATTPAATTPDTSKVGEGQAVDGGGASVSGAGNVRGERVFFSPDSPWNTRLDGKEVDARSNTMIQQAIRRIGVVERSGNLPPTIERRSNNSGLYINTEEWTTPLVSGGSATTFICRQIICGNNKDLTSLNVPADTSPDPRYDGWFSVVSTDNRFVYDFWRARRERNGTISYQYVRRWDAGGKGFDKPGTVSARGSGLPLFAGLIRPRELSAGQINHALAISVPAPAQRKYVQPASATDGNGDVTSLPEGARIRLRSDAVLRPSLDSQGRRIKRTKAQQRYADSLIYTLRHYGAIVVDRAKVPTLYAQRDVTSELLRGNELQGLKLTDFEVMQVGKVYNDPPLGTTEQSGPNISPGAGQAGGQ